MTERRPLNALVVEFQWWERPHSLWVRHAWKRMIRTVMAMGEVRFEEFPYRIVSINREQLD